MTGAAIAAVCIGGALLMLATLGLIIIGIIRASRTGGIFKKERQANAEETRMIQEMYSGLSKMEERIEALETILIERQAKDKNR